MTTLYADIIIDISTESLDRTFQYRIPEGLEDAVSPGSLVMIPFGRGDRVRSGYVVNITDKPEFDPARTKDILSVKEDNKDRPVGNLLRLASWMKHDYGGTLIQSLKVVLPKKTPLRLTLIRRSQMTIPGRCWKSISEPEPWRRRNRFWKDCFNRLVRTT